MVIYKFSQIFKLFKYFGVELLSRLLSDPSIHRFSLQAGGIWPGINFSFKNPMMLTIEQYFFLQALTKFFWSYKPAEPLRKKKLFDKIFIKCKFPLRELFNLSLLCDKNFKFMMTLIKLFIVSEAINDFDGGSRKLVGVNGTGIIFASFPAPYLSNVGGFIDLVGLFVCGLKSCINFILKKVWKLKY